MSSSPPPTSRSPGHLPAAAPPASSALTAAPTALLPTTALRRTAFLRTALLAALRTALLAAFLATLSACTEPPNWKDPSWPDAGPAATDAGRLPWDTGLPSGRTGAKDVATGPAACPDHVLECAPGRGCVDGVCGACQEGGDCRALEGCVQGVCGRCTKADQCKKGKSCINGFCLREPMKRWNLLVDPAQFTKIVGHPYGHDYVPCKLEVDGKIYAPCQVRIRGGISRDYPKKSFRIRFARDAEHPGYSRKINLRAEYNDSTFMRNFLASWLFDQLTDVPTPRVRYRRLSVNGKDAGIYAEVERIGEKFRRLRGRDPNAPLYEADPSHAVEPKGAAALLKLPSEALYKQAYQKHSDPKEDYQDLMDFIEKTVVADYEEGTSTRIRTRVALAWYLDYLAVHAAMMNADHVRKNYYLSLQEGAAGQRWEFYPWDMDMSFGCVWHGGDDNNLCIKLGANIPVEVGMVPAGTKAVYGAKGVFYNLLIHDALSAKDLRADFYARVCKIVASKQWKQALPQLIDALELYLSPEVLTDTADLNTSLKEFKDRVAELRKWIEQRDAVLRFDLDCG